MAEVANFDPGPWRDRTFAQARSRYDDTARASKDRVSQEGITNRTIVPNRLRTLAKVVAMILCDMTGSMEDAPRTIWEKLAYFDLESESYLGKDRAICVGAFGDANQPRPCVFPLQIRHFAKGRNLETEIGHIVKTGFNGGAQLRENSELAALYCLKNIDTPNVDPFRQKPILIIITDEAPYDYVDHDFAQAYAHVPLRQNMATSALFDQLTRRFSVYVVLKPYGNETYGLPSDRDGVYIRDYMQDRTKWVFDQWVPLVGIESIAMMPDPRRVVDIMFGLFANETGLVPYFREEVRNRQTSEQYEQVDQSLHTVHRNVANPASVSNSTVRVPQDYQAGS